MNLATCVKAEKIKLKNWISFSFNFAVEDVQFLRYSCTKLNNFKSFQKFKDLVSTLHVTNDLGERGIKILEDINRKYKRINRKFGTKTNDMTLHGEK